MFLTDLFWNRNVFNNDLYDSITTPGIYYFFVDDIKIYRTIIKSSQDYNLLQSDIDSIQTWITAKYMILIILKLMYIILKENQHSDLYLWNLSILCNPTRIFNNDQGVLLDPKLNFHDHVDYIFSVHSVIWSSW
jgi:hypothetical protein